MILFANLLQLAVSDFLTQYKRVSKYIAAASSLLAITLFTYIAAFPTPEGNGDYKVYLASYGTPANESFEKGYALLADLASDMNLSYPAFRFITFFIAFCILWIAIRRFTDKTSYVFLLYGIGLFTVDIVQVRSFFMLVIAFLGYSFFIKKNIVNYIIGIALIYISAKFHNTGYLFLLPVPFTLLSVKTLRKYTPIFFYICFVLFLFAYPLRDFTGVIQSHFMSADKADLYDPSASGNGAGLRIINILEFQGWVLMIPFLYLLFRFVKHVERIAVQVKNTDFTNRVRVLLPIVLLIFPTALLEPANFSYTRIPRNAMLALFILCGVLLSSQYGRLLSLQTRRHIYWVSLAFAVMTLVAFYFLYGDVRAMIPSIWTTELDTAIQTFSNPFTPKKLPTMNGV